MSVSCDYVFCQIEVSAMGRSLVQRSPTEYGVSECGLEASISSMPWPPSAAIVPQKIMRISILKSSLILRTPYVQQILVLQSEWL